MKFRDLFCRMLFRSLASLEIALLPPRGPLLNRLARLLDRVDDYVAVSFLDVLGKGVTGVETRHTKS
jgi:hypothetical protein